MHELPAFQRQRTICGTLDRTRLAFNGQHTRENLAGVEAGRKGQIFELEVGTGVVRIVRWRWHSHGRVANEAA